MVATYAPEGVTDDNVAVIVRKVEQMHGLRHNVEVSGPEGGLPPKGRARP